MDLAISIRGMEASDLEFADFVREAAGWNQPISYWKRLLEWEPEGCFVASWEGELAGTATTTGYGLDLAWIGMVLVRPEMRGRGVGRALMERCLSHLRGKGISSIRLDATPMGRELYEGLGFRVELGVTRWELVGNGVEGMDSSFRPWHAAPREALEELDRAAFGVSRWRVVEGLSRDSIGSMVDVTPGGVVRGYGLLREGVVASSIGPVVSTNAERGEVLVRELVRCAGGGRLFWDIPDTNEVARALAVRLGFVVQRNLFRMVWGEAAGIGKADWQFAIADPSVG